MIASRWLGMDTVSESNAFSREILRVEFSLSVADQLSLAGEQHFGP